MDFTRLPQDLPVPVDDGAADHLEGKEFPDRPFPSTGGKPVNIRALDGLVVLYIYPMTGRPGVPLPDGWDDIPGARGCTPQSCGYRDAYPRLKALEARVHGLSSQQTDYQQEARGRLKLPHHLLSDASLVLRDTLDLPTFTTSGQILYRRMTLVIGSGRILKVFYPVFPPDADAGQVIDWLASA